MLIKMIGGACVIAASSGLGISMAGQWKKRLELLEQLRKMIFLLKGEILYANAPLEEAFERVGNKSGGVLGTLFTAVSQRIRNQCGEPFFTMWIEEINGMDSRILLSKEDRQSLISFGEHLGYLDCEMQERTILLYLEQLDLTIAYLREHQREKSRLYTSLGIMGGLFLTIVMC
ncbi:MAG: stage III sporulation protein AB [Clostridiaceae bacterium]|nr:stage III sporulation protein AB [Clostridiaceae bacterium]